MVSLDRFLRDEDEIVKGHVLTLQRGKLLREEYSLLSPNSPAPPFTPPPLPPQSKVLLKQSFLVCSSVCFLLVTTVGL